MLSKVSVSIPTYNRVDLVNRLVQSIPNNVFVSISDNGSFLKDSGLLRKDNCKIDSHSKVKDVFDNWNHALLMSLERSEVVTIPSDDDLYLEGAFSIAIDYINKIDADVYVFGHHNIDEDDNVIGTSCVGKLEVFDAPNGFFKYKYGVEARMPSVFFKSEFLKSIGLFDTERFKLTAADSELIQRSLLLGRVAFIPEVISCYRVWGGSLTNAKIASKLWLDEIEAWTSKIIEIGEKETDFFCSSFSNSYADEIYARNLYAGLANLYKQKQYRAIQRFFKECRWPSFAMKKTKLHILLLLARSKILLYVS